MRWPIMLLTLLVAISLSAPAQDKSDSSQTAETVCSFQDGNQISIRYPGVPAQKQLRSGEVWPPSSSPIFVFSTAEFTFGTSVVPRGAYSMYVIPNKVKWTLAINKSVTPGASYQEQQDVARQAMEIAQLDAPQKFEIAFGQVGPKQCNLRIYYGKTGAWGAEFKEK